MLKGNKRRRKYGPYEVSIVCGDMTLAIPFLMLISTGFVVSSSSRY
jgi:hypothetical protein